MALSAKQVGAVAAGNALEFYDFLTFSFFATQLGNVFFPVQNENSRLLLALATFGVGFLVRPLGGILIGRMGDRRGRKPAMLLSFGLMGFSVVGLALTPSYASIGLAAPLLVVLFRLLQGFALGGEVGPSSAFLMEAAPPARRGLLCGAAIFHPASGDLGGRRGRPHPGQCAERRCADPMGLARRIPDRGPGGAVRPLCPQPVARNPVPAGRPVTGGRGPDRASCCSAC